MEQTECRELLEVHRNVIDVKLIAFLVILLASEDSFVTLHMRWHKGYCCNSIQKTKRQDQERGFQRNRVQDQM